MSMFRSDRMGYYSLMMPREYAWEVLNELGELDSLQFVDMNAQETAFNRPYSNYVRRCEDLEIKINSIEQEMQRFEIPVEKCDDPKLFLRNLKNFYMSRNKTDRTYFEDLESHVEDKLANLNEQIRNYDNLVSNYNHLVEFKQVLLQTRPYIGDREFRANYAGEGEGPTGGIDQLARGNISFRYLAGVINREDSLRFKKILFRVTRGMAWTALLDIAKPKERENEKVTYFKEGAHSQAKPKTVFLIVYQGGSYDMMKAKLNRICDSFSASKYGIPEEPGAFNQKLQEIDAQIREAENVINVTEGQIKHLLNFFSEPRNYNYTYSLIEDLKLFVMKEKTIYHNLNTLKTKNALYQGYCWCPIETSDRVRLAIIELKRRKSEIGGCEFKDAPFPTDMQPPTYFRTNDVTWVFQEIVNTYGIPRYREVNPGLFTVATFPFLFGVMFGDIGHGGLILAFAAYLCINSDKIAQEKKGLLYTALPGRYLLLLQGIFATYCGFIYNDFMAMPWNLFGSCYGHHMAEGENYVVKEADCNYAFGIDPGWFGTSNELTFLNSFKMKLSIILGVSHMLFGIFLRGINNFHFNDYLGLFFEFIPMVLFLSLTFGYMAILIMFKWLIPWGTGEYTTDKAPSIIGIFIKMALSPGQWDKTQGIPLYGDAEGTEQAELQMSFLIVAMVCAVLILVPKPLILLLKHGGGGSGSSSAPKGYTAQLDDPTVNQRLLEHEQGGDQVLMRDPEPHGQPGAAPIGTASGHGHGHGDHFEFGEVFVHQVIETIEFVLGSISNTASYLRLWALSLAHSQLAKVFYENTIGSAIASGSFMLAFLGFLFFAHVTLGVLLLMDQMECFLHALRLHWVEFQNKFYKADGYGFEPFSFEKTLKPATA